MNIQSVQAIDPENSSWVDLQYDGEKHRCPAVISQRFRITGILATGGFGLIFKAEDQVLFQKKVLIKTSRYPAFLFNHQKDINRPKAIEKFRFRLSYECKMLLQAARRGISGTPVILDYQHAPGPDLHGPHVDEQGREFICEDIGENGAPLWLNEPYLVLSFVDGRPLSRAIGEASFRNNSLGNAKQVILQIGRILQSFHQEQIVKNRKMSFIYQDLKPDNILVTQEKQFVLIDFGGFAMRADGKTLANFAKTGTPGYQPPEFVNFAYPPDRIDATADIFSLGAVVYHMLGGAAPLASPGGEAIFDASVLQSFPVPWREWVEKAIAPEPCHRFQRMNIAIEAAHNLPLKP
jgi:serine/threonine protein kinase